MVPFQCYRRAGDGTPIIPDEGIEKYAGRLIKDYNPKYLKEPWRLKEMALAERYCNAELCFADIYCEENEQIAGATIFNRERVKLFDHDNLCTKLEVYEPNTILIDNETMKEGREAFARFTILHEIGHLCMHGEVFRKKQKLNVPNNAPGLVCCRRADVMGVTRDLKTQEEFREHQANVFAAAVAMPREAFSEVALDWLDKMGCHEGYYLLPTIRETDPDECADFLIEKMAMQFNVSRTAARVQLRRYGLIKRIWELRGKRY